MTINQSLEKLEGVLPNEIINQLASDGYVIVPKEPTEAMLDAARDWSRQKYGQPVGNDGASGCYRSMIAANT